MQTESELVSSILAGRQDAFRELVRRYERLVAEMVSRVLQGQDGEPDVRQEVFLQVYRKLHMFRQESTLSTWIARIAYRTALNHVKSRSRRRATDLDALDELAAEDVDSEARLAVKNVHDFIHRQVRRLPLHYRTVVTLYHFQELTYTEIATVMGLPEGTVKSYLFRARQWLKEQLKSYKSHLR